MECTPRGIWMYESGDGPSFVPGSETSTWAGRGQDFQAFLLQVRRQYRGWKVTVLLDSDSSHKAKTSQTLATQLGVRLLWLPKRAPEMNPMDTLWGQAKDVISANNQYTSIDQQVESFHHASEQLVEQGRVTDFRRTLSTLLVETSFIKKLLRTCLANLKVRFEGRGGGAPAFREKELRPLFHLKRPVKKSN
jgi:hypothetical protein